MSLPIHNSCGARLWGVVAGVMLSSACASSTGIRDAAPEVGSERWFDAPAIEMLEIARSVLTSTDYRVREEKRNSDTSWHLIATRGSRFGGCLSEVAPSLGLGCPMYEAARVRLVGSVPDSTHVWVYTEDELLTVGRPEMILTKLADELCVRRPATCR